MLHVICRETRSADGRVQYDPDRFRVRLEPIEIDDQRLKGVWGDVLYRISLRAVDPKTQDSWRLRFRR